MSPTDMSTYCISSLFLPERPEQNLITEEKVITLDGLLQSLLLCFPIYMIKMHTIKRSKRITGLARVIEFFLQNIAKKLLCLSLWYDELRNTYSEKFSNL